MPLGWTVIEARSMPFARHEGALDVVQHLVRVHVGVVVRGGNGLRMVVEQPRHEGADYEARPVEGLVHRRRLVDAPGDRLEVLDVEGVGPQMAVPADNVQRVVLIDQTGDHPARLDSHLEFAGLVVGRQLVGRTDVALAVG